MKYKAAYIPGLFLLFSASAGPAAASEAGFAIPSPAHTAGAITALSLAAAISFSVFRSKFRNWMAWHHRAAWLTAVMAAAHIWLVMTGRFVWRQ